MAIVVILFILLVILLVGYCSGDMGTLTGEPFIGRLGSTCNPAVCADQKTITPCLNCYECGYCMNKSGGRCVPGSPNGPYPIDGKVVECEKWYHDDPFSVYKNGLDPWDPQTAHYAH